MSDDTGPIINITTTKPLNFEDQRRNQQLPNRNRVIIRKPFPVGSSSTRPTNPQRNPDYQRASEWRPSTGNFPSRPEGPRDFKRPLPVETAESQFIRRTEDLLNGKSRSVETPTLGENVSGRRTGAEEDLSLAPSPPKKKKIKPQLSVPTSAGQVSGNWQGLQKSLGLKDRPRGPKKIAEASKKQSEVGNFAESVPEAEIPEAVADTFVKTKSFSGLTKTVALDCEFVGVGPGARENMLARVSLVNQFGHCVYDKFVKPTELVKDYRTHVSGVRPQDLKKGEDFKVVQKEVSEILEGRTLVGHAVHNDLEVLLLSHPKSDVRDTSKFKAFRQLNKGGTPSLKKLTAKVLGFSVQGGEHDSVQDAQATMRLYTMYKREWESQVSLKGKKLRMMQKKKPNPTT